MEIEIIEFGFTDEEITDLEITEEEIMNIIYINLLIEILSPTIPTIPTEHETIDFILIDTTMCSICLDIYKPTDIICKTKCSHIYHKHCINEWNVIHNTCPLCRECF